MFVFIFVVDEDVVKIEYYKVVNEGVKDLVY